MFEAQTADAFGSDWTSDVSPRPSQPPTASGIRETGIAYGYSIYAPAKRHRLIPFVIAMHLLTLWAVVHFDVVHFAHKRPPLEVKLIPLDAPPPPLVAPPAQPAAKLQTSIVSPPPIVQQPFVAPTPVLNAPVIAPPAPSAPAAPAAPVMAEAAPIVPPDGMAATLGNSPPSYPMESRRQREEGTVRLRVLISSTGSVEEISIAKSSGFDRLDDSALRAVRKWRFRPGTQAGTPVEAIGFLSIPFKLTHA